MAKLIQICASENDLFDLDSDGVVYHYNFNTNGTAHRSGQERQGPSRSQRILRSTGWMPTGEPTPRIECACERGDASAERAGRSFDSRARSLVQFATSASALIGYRHEHAAAAGMKGWYRIEFRPDFVRIEGLARGAWQARVLANDPGSNPLTGVVGAHGRTAGEHVEPLGKQIEFAEPIRLRFRCVRRRDAVEALPSSWKRVGGGKGSLPAIEVGPREIWSAGCHRGGFSQPRRAMAVVAEADDRDRCGVEVALSLWR